MIPETWTYLLVDLACISVPLLFSFHPRLKFYRQWRYFLVPNMATMLLFLVWDGLFTSWGVWGFNRDYVLGYFLFGMPLEEYLFFLCIPYASVFSYYCFSVLLPSSFLKTSSGLRAFVLFLVCVLLLIGLTHVSAWYTSVTFLLLSATWMLLLLRRVNFIGLFLVTYLFILVPFVLSNGVLTGSFLGRVVVWYDDTRNLGIRLLTIPVEDVFYGMLLLLLNVSGFEWLRRKRNVHLQ